MDGAAYPLFLADLLLQGFLNFTQSLDTTFLSILLFKYNKSPVQWGYLLRITAIYHLFFASIRFSFRSRETPRLQNGERVAFRV